MTGNDAFISYSHAGDGDLAVCVERGLRRIATPWYRLPTLRVFRDDTGLAATSTLWSTIESELERSRYLVLLASPIAAERPWVNREIEWWLENRSTDTLMLALTDGELDWSDDGDDFSARSTALPAPLRGRFDEEPLWIDLRWAKGQRPSLREPDFRDSIARLAAPMHGPDVTPASLVGEDVRQQRNRRRWRNAAIAGLLVLAVIAAGAAVIAQRQAVEARRQAAEARRQTAEAQRQRDIAVSRQLAAQADMERNDRVDRSLLLALAALEIDDTAEARSALAGAIEEAPSLEGYLHGSNGSAGMVAFDPTGRFVLTGDGNAVRLWRASNDRPVGPPLREHRAAVTAGAFGDGGKRFATASSDGHVALWNTARRALVRSHTIDVARVDGVAFDAALGRAAVAAGPDGVRIIDLDSGDEVARAAPDADDQVVSVAFSPDGQTVAFGSAIGTIQFLDLSTAQIAGARIEIPIGDYPQDVGTLTFSPDGRTLASGSPGGIVNLWSVGTGQLLGGFGDSNGERGPVTALAFSSAGHHIISGHQDREVNVWYVDEYLLVNTLAGHGVVESLAVRPDDAIVAVASAEGPVVMYDLSGQQRGRMARDIGPGGASAYMDNVTWSPDGDLLAATTFDELHLYDGTSGDQRGRPLIWGRHMFYDALDFSPDGSLIASGVSQFQDDADQAQFATRGALVVWDVAESTRMAGPLRDGGATVRSVDFSPDGDLLAVGDEDGVVELWDSDDWQRNGDAVRLDGADIRAVRFSPDGELIAVADVDGAIELWDVAARRRVGDPLRATGATVTTVAFTPDGTRLVSGDQDGLVEIWDTATGERQGEPLADLSDQITEIAVSHDGRRVAVVGGRTAAVSLWDIEARRLIVRPAVGRADSFESVAFSPDGAHLAWGSYSIAPAALLVRWDADIDAWRQHACALAGRDITQREWNRYIGSQRERVRLCDDFPRTTAARRDSTPADTPEAQAADDDRPRASEPGPSEQCAGLRPASESAEIRFRPGSSSGTVDDTAQIDEPTHYQLAASAGQRIEIVLDAPHLVCLTNDSGLVAAGVNEVTSNLPTSGMYSIAVLPLEATGRYTMRVSIP